MPDKLIIYAQFVTILTGIVVLLKQQLALKGTQKPQNSPVSVPVSVPTPKPMPNSQKLYETAKSLLGTHLTLDPSVPPDLGCAECWSAVANIAGVKGVPAHGFPGTIGVHDFLASNPLFQEVDKPEPGATIVSVSHGNQHGHVGYVGNYNTQYKWDWGIMSNDSDTGLLREKWNYKDWMLYYKDQLGLVTKIYKWKD